MGHDLRYSVDITKIRDELGYRAAGAVRGRGWRSTVAWYRE